MKSLILALFTTVSFNAFSQSYLVMDNGIVVTNDKAGFVYDFGHYAYPHKITMKGGQFFVEENNILVTVDENGFLFRKYEYIPEKIIGKGINYFLSADGELTTIDKAGVAKMIQDETFSKATHFGGNYFVVTSNEETKEAVIYTVNAEGVATSLKIDSFKTSDVVTFGGSYFMNNRGVVHTVDKNGRLSPRADVRVGILAKKGGNYFTDSSGMLFTVAQDGSIRMPALPVNLKVSSITKLGSNYFLDISGKLFVVDQDGNIFERVMRDHDFRHARVISL